MDLDGVSLPQHYAGMVQDLRSSLPPGCRWLGSDDINLISERPSAAGGFADIYDAMQGGRKVILKSYRCYRSFEVAEVVAVRRSHSICRAYH